MSTSEPGVVPSSAGEVLAFEAAVRDLVGVALRSVDRAEISLPQFRLLLTLHELGPASSSRCARALGVVGSTVTRLADRLHASGHLTRGADPDNRSIVMLALTESGQATVEQVTARRRTELRDVLDRLDPTLRAACAEALDRLHGLLDDAAANGSGNDGHRHHVPM